MAVVQISRIQVRRGKEETAGMPQLASGEIAWAIDTQKLYIGNGAVSEGSPYVGNTKILTEHDNLLDLAGQYEYKTNDSGIQTGVNISYPVIRSLQERLDERVSAYSFGAVGDGQADETATLQQAIDQLFMSSTARADNMNKVVLEIPPGVYKITDTLYIPSYATLIGAGPGRTVINYIGEGLAIKFVNDSSRPGNINPASTSDTNQPRFITMKGITIESQTQNQTVMLFESVIDSVFEDLTVTGQWEETPDVSPSAVGGLHFVALGSGIHTTTCQRNRFKGITLSGFTYAVFAKWDIFQNEFTECRIYDCYQGFRLGKGINGSGDGQKTGPRNTIITSTTFNEIKREAVYVDNGYGNHVTGCTFTNVGNDGGGNTTALYKQVYFAVDKNSSHNNYSDRHKDLASDNLTLPYIGVNGGKTTNDSFGVQTLTILTSPNVTADPLFRLPVSPDVTGYTINYTYKSDQSWARYGTMTIMVDAVHNRVQLSDDYEWVAADDTNAKVLDFSVILLSLGGIRNTLAVYYKNALSVNETASFTYSYSIIQ
jgi:hypothetical protein